MDSVQGGGWCGGWCLVVSVCVLVFGGWCLVAGVWWPVVGGLVLGDWRSVAGVSCVCVLFVPMILVPCVSCLVSCLFLVSDLCFRCLVSCSLCRSP